MAEAARLGDQAQASGEKICPICGASPKGDAKTGSADVFINGRASLRLQDEGDHGTCSWQATSGSPGVTINGKPAMRYGDSTEHCAGAGQIIQGSPDVFIGDYGGSSQPIPHDKTASLQVTDALGRPVHDVVATPSCPHTAHDARTFDGSTSIGGLCSGASVTVQKSLQKGVWDANAVSAAAPAHAVAVPDAASGNLVVHAPAPAATAGNSDHAAYLPRPTTAPTTVLLPTVHNWVELVYRLCGFDIPTGKTELAILGVREMSLAGKGSVDALEADAREGAPKKTAFTREGRAASLAEAPTTWNDLLFCVYTADDVHKTQHVEVFECTIDAGAAESDAPGLPITLEGRLYRGHPGDHIPSRYPGDNVCLHLYSGTPGRMELARDCTKTSRTLTSIASAKNVKTHYRFADDEANSSIHMHFGAEYASVGNWSTGCTVLHHHYYITGKDGLKHADPEATRYRRFMDLFNGASNKSQIPYLVVSSKYIKSYSEWTRAIADKPTEIPQPKSVLLTSALQTPTGKTDRYVPSFMTREFANDVIALAAAKTTDKVQAQNLQSSLDLCLLRFAT